MESSYKPNVVITADGREVSYEHLRDGVIYSTAELQSDEGTDVTLFGYRKGEKLTGQKNTTTATEVHTNVNHKGTMPKNERLVVHIVAVEFDNDVPNAALQMCDDTLLQIHAGGTTDLLMESVKHFPSGTGIGGNSVVNGAFALGNGAVDWNARRRIGVPILVDGSDDYDAVLKIPTVPTTWLCADFMVRVNLFGLRSTPA